jgi:hypothetical protein
MYTSGLPIITNGLNPDPSGGQTAMVSGGLSPITVPQPNSNEAPATDAQDAAAAAAIAQSGGFLIPGTGLPQPGATTSIGVPLGLGQNAPFNLNDIIQDPTSLLGKQVFNSSGSLTADVENAMSTYTGSDLRIIVDLVNTSTASNNAPQLYKQLIECTTFTVSIHREKSAVRAAGYINPKGFARGRRTIAGTMVLTQYTVDALYNFLMSQQLMAHDLSKDTQYVKDDQLPPFNMTLLFADEYGNTSYRRVLAVDFVTDGVVYSTNDMMSEQTISYMASDFTPLLSGTDSAMFTPDTVTQIVSAERTVQTVLGGQQQRSIPSTNIFSRNV